MAALINTAIPKTNWETVRDVIAQILATEIENQNVNNFIPDAGWEAQSHVWTERFVPFDKSEVPAVNVMFSRVSYNNEHVGHSDGIYVFNIDCYAYAKSTDGNDGDKDSMFKLQRLIGLCRSILMDPRYIRLGIAPPNVMNRTIQSIEIGQTENDSLSVTFGRIALAVRIPESIQFIPATALNLANTQIKLEETNQGYYWSTINYP